LETIVTNADVGSQVALTTVCKALSFVATTVLYRNYDAFDWTKDRIRRLERSLGANPSNAMILFVYPVTNIALLQAIWSSSPLRLKKLVLALNAYGPPVSESSWTTLASTIHPDTIIDEVSFKDSAMYSEVKSNYLLSASLSLRGLVRLECDLVLQPDEVNLSSLLHHLDCPHVEHITVHISQSPWHVVPSPNLRRLRTLHLQFVGGDSLNDIAEQSTWTFLKSMMDRDVFLRINKASPTDVVHSFFRTVHLHAINAELPVAITWLIQGERHFQIVIDRRKEINLDIRDLTPSWRDTTIQLIHADDQPDGFRISIFDSDSGTPNRAGSIVDILPKSVSSLDLVVQQNIIPEFMPNLLRSLPSLRTLSVNVYSLPPSGPSPRRFIPTHSCTRSAYYIPYVKRNHGEQQSYELVMAPGNVVLWRYYAWGGPSQELPKALKTSTADLCFEMESWFAVALSLGSLHFRFWTGYPWAFIFSDQVLPWQF
jgi:hypothetical protein